MIIIIMIVIVMSVYIITDDDRDTTAKEKREEKLCINIYDIAKISFFSNAIFVLLIFFCIVYRVYPFGFASFFFCVFGVSLFR